MSIGIPIGPPTSAGTALVPAPVGVRLNIPIRLGVPTVGVSPLLRGLPNAQLLAVAAAASEQDPADALLLARRARKKPEKALTQVFDEKMVAEILAEVRSAQEDPALAIGPPSAALRASAEAVGANPRLAVAAGSIMNQTASGAKPDPAHPELARGWHARRWAIGLLDPDILDRAARAALRARALGLLDVEQDVRTLQRKVRDLETSVGGLRTDVDILKSSHTAPTPPTA